MREEKQEQTSKSNVPIFLSLFLLGAAILCYFLIADFQLFVNNAWEVLRSNDEARIKNWVADLGWYGPIILVLAMVVQMFLLVIPTFLLMVVSILAYGPIWGTLVILAAVFTASTVGYAIGRYFGEVFVMRLLGKATEKKVESFINKYGFGAVIITRLNPFLSNDAISFVGGILKMGYWKFIAATIVGILPLTIFIAILEKSIAQLETGLFWGSMASLIAFISYVLWKKQKKTKFTN